MSVCAVMLVKNEADVIEHTLEHLLGQVDDILVSDNGSTDGTLEILGSFFERNALTFLQDFDPAYYQAEKTTRLARLALREGHSWVVPCDADEMWYATDRRPIRDFLAGLAPDVQVARAELYDHVPTALDDEETLNPFRRIGWRLRQRSPLHKVACRLHPDVHIAQGNHACWLPGQMLTVPGLCVRHFSWRSEQQYVSKITNGAAAYAATDLPETTGAHWRMFGNPPDPVAVAGHFRTWFHSDDPAANDSLIYDPAPL